MGIRHRLDVWIVRRILRRHYGRMTLKDGTLVTHQSREFYDWCYGTGYQIFAQRRAMEATNGQE